MTDHMGHWKPEWDRRSPQFARRIRRGLLRDLGLLAALLCCFEIVLQLAGYGEQRRVGHVTGVGSNAFGYREPLVSSEKNPDEFRVLAIGDSTTFGTGVRWDETFSEQSEKRLRAGSPGRNVSVINAGGQGATFRDLLRKLPEHCERINPHVVVLSLSASFPARYSADRLQHAATKADAGLGTQALASAQAAKRVLARVNLWTLRHVRTRDFFQHEIIARLYQARFLKEDVDAAGGYAFAYAFEPRQEAGSHARRVKGVYRAMEQDLLAIRERLSRRGISLLITTLPARFMLSDLPADNLRSVDKSRIRIDPDEHWRGVAQRHGIGFVDCRARLEWERRRMIEGRRAWDDLYVPNDIMHFNAAGHRVIAEAMQDALARDVKIPSRVARPQDMSRESL